jgi:hypothetical protein
MLTENFHPILDSKMISLRAKWFSETHCQINYKEFIPKASEWFRSSKINQLTGWESLPLIDVTTGCTHYIESLALKYGWNGFQILKHEYAYYTLMGKHGVDVEQLEPKKPLIITMPHWQFCDLRPEWPKVLSICEQRNIDIHIDMAWIITARDISIDFSHPCIKSVGMSLSKYGLQWSRAGIRFSKQKTMDSITIYNDYYRDTNTVLTSVGSFWIDNFDRDYAWNVHGNNHYELCKTLGLESTKIIHIARDPESNKLLGIGKILGETAPDRVQ